MIGFFIGTVFFMGPDLVSKALTDPVEELSKGNLKYLHIDYLNGRKGNYIELVIKMDSLIDKSTFYTKEYGHKNLVGFLVEQNIIHHSNRYSQLDSIVPYVMDPEYLSQLGDVYYEIENHQIVKLKAGNHFIIGSVPGLGKRIFLFLFGLALIVIGAGLSALAVYSLFLNFRTYQNTGNLPELTNSFDSKVNGIKFLLGIKSKK